jgi:hypothetical protein
MSRYTLRLNLREVQFRNTRSSVEAATFPLPQVFDQSWHRAKAAAA